MQNKTIFILTAIIVVIISACSSKPKMEDGFAFQRQTFSADTTLDKIYITDTKPVDSINPKQAIFDIFRLEYDNYPDSIFLYARPYDSLGNFITQMAFPYKVTDHNYFPNLREKLGKVYGVRSEEIKEFNVREYGIGDSIAFNIMLTLDYSGSISQILDVILEGTELFVHLKFPYDKIGINSFNQDFTEKVPMMMDSSLIMKIFRAKINEDQGLFSAVNDAAFNSIKLFENTKKEVPRILVLFTDGDDNYSKATVKQVVDLANDLDVNIFTVAFGYSIDENLKFMSEFTGGKFYKAYSKEELLAVFRDIYNSLRNYYLVSYHPPEYWGYHKAFLTLDIPGRDSVLIADAEYNTADINPLSADNDVFKRPILFEFDSSAIKAESYNILDEITDVLYVYPKVRLEIQGHTDSKGAVDYNQRLSERRADAVMQALLERGIHPRRLRSRGFGESQPLVPNTSEENMAKNRRTQFVIIAK